LKSVWYLGLSLLLLAACSPIRVGGPTGAPTPREARTATVTEVEIQATPTLPLTPTTTPQALYQRPAVCRDRHGQIETFSYQGVALREEIPVRVYLPPCYASSDREYPTLYLLHGYPYTETHWDDLGIDELVTAGISAGAWPPFLLVMPFQPQPLFTRSDGGPGSYEEEFLGGLIPAVEARYRAIPQADGRGLVGISRGGVWALEISFRHPTALTAVAALSPALNVNFPRPSYDPFLLAAEGEQVPEHVFLAAGRGEPSVLRKTVELRDILETTGAAPIFMEVAGAHEASTWQALMGPMVAFVVHRWEANNLPGWPPQAQHEKILVQ
jgi:enterochelin esterase-like enzyme